LIHVQFTELELDRISSTRTWISIRNVDSNKIGTHRATASHSMVHFWWRSRLSLDETKGQARPITEALRPRPPRFPVLPTPSSILMTLFRPLFLAAALAQYASAVTIYTTVFTDTAGQIVEPTYTNTATGPAYTGLTGLSFRAPQ
jgi:hypothetical protein